MRLAELLAGEALGALERGGLSPAAAAAKSPLFARVAAALVQSGRAPENDVHAFFVPGRIEVLGKHTDYAGGRSVVAAVERGFCMVAAPRDDARVTVMAVESGERIECELDAELVVPESGWANYPMTVVRRLARNFGDLRGVDIAFLSDLPAAAGMSSSSAFMVSTYLVLAARNNLHERPVYRDHIREDLELAAYLGTVENGQSFGNLAGDRGVGTFGGSEDHTAILCSEPGRLGQFAYCPARLEQRLVLPEDYIFAVGFCGVVAEKTGAAQHLYNRAALQVGAIVEAWRAETGKSEVYLADVLASDPDAAAQLEAILTRVSGAAYSAAELTQRLRHFLIEDGEIIDAASAALVGGDVEDFAEQVRRSQRAGAEVLGNQIVETEDMARLACQEGALAASAFGAGFGGGVWALVPCAGAEVFLRAWEAAYRTAHPMLAEQALYFSTRPGPAAFAL